MKVNVDKLGAVASSICAVHCVLTGLALGLLSVVGFDFIGSPTTEAFFIVLTVSLGSWAVIHGIRKHHSAVPAIFFVCGLASILMSHVVFGHSHSGVVHWSLGATISSVLGGLCLVTFHALNLRLANHCSSDHCRTGR